MKHRIIEIAALLLTVLALTAGVAFAACTTTTYILGNGTMKVCTECCTGGLCTVSCM